MTRPVLLVDIGSSPLPVVTPVQHIAASWAPSVYVAPPPPAPTALTATSVADGVALAWAAGPGKGIAYRIERAPDVAGAPGTWLQIGTADATTFTATLTDVAGYWFRVRAVRNGQYSSYASPVYQYAFVTNPPPLVLEITDGTITIDCRYKSFVLVLDRDVDIVHFTFVRPETTVVVDVQQNGGGNTLQLPPHVRPINGVPYRASPVSGSIDVVGLKTVNAGESWLLTAQQPAGGGSAFAAVVAPSPAEATAYYDGNGPVSPVITVTLAEQNGVAPISVQWQRADLSGGEDFLCSDRTAMAPVFSVPADVTAFRQTQQWTATLKDRAARVLQVQVSIKLQRIVTYEDLSALLQNPDFEAGNAGWDVDAPMLISNEVPYNGRYSMMLGTGQWGTFEARNMYSAVVSPGNTLQARCMVHQGASDRYAAGGWVRIKWYDANGQFMFNSDGNNVDDGSGGAWHPSSLTVTVPPGAARARLTAVLWRTRQNKTCHADAFQWARL
ncbi:hypothetical protein [Stenotrophomonas sp. 364]|uniref:hypothetical protein n=1 Tax=Stenotrophomonas sp. 364 TaxID=2691571 RepID=UPI001318524B|nr:hypothetical protein [Stenotrophomonas sp. 364]QHB72930.1 hypothetical protein GQ674_17255 [Stenotrophomonas sp. 364]